MSDDLAKRLRETTHIYQVDCELKMECADRIDELEAKLAKVVDALRELIDHTHNCEKELTEELHGVDFCGESLPLTNARTTLAELKEQGDE